MKKIYILWFIFSCIAVAINAQTVLNEGFESSNLNPAISFQSTGTFLSPPGIVNNTNFGSTKVFSFGKSICGSSCFNNYKTTLIISFPSPTMVDSIIWKEMEIAGNWGSQGQVFLDDVVFGGATLGALPVNSGVPNSTPQIKAISINQMVTTIKFLVNDITSSSEIIIDDLQIKYTSTPKIVGYEFWFNNDFANKTTTMVALAQQLMINQTVPTTGLNQGLNTLNFRSLDDYGKYSNIVSQLFYKTNSSESNGSPNIVAYEYWLNNDYANAVLVNTPVQQQININELISMSSLNNGIHNFNIRFKDNTGLWSSVSSNMFYKTNSSESNGSPNIVAYEYWLDNDFSNAVVVNTPTQQQLNINELISMSTLPNGVHHFNIRFKDNAGLWSSVTSNLFYKTPQQIVTQNSITEYRYWFDNDFANVVNIAVTPNQNVNLMNNINLAHLPKGKHEVQFQFKDSLGLWSVVLSDSIQKNSLLIANFSFQSNPTCDSTTIDFTQECIDGDTYFWNFDDGNTSTSPNPSHTYHTPNTYFVSLTITDTILGIDTTKVIPIVVNTLQSYASISETACNSYTAPDGQVYSTSGIKTAIIPNAAGCDSTITINLTITQVDTTITQNGVILSANANVATYQWLNCTSGNSEIVGETNQQFTPTMNGSYAVVINQNNCIDTSACIAITTIEVNESITDREILVFPNPTQGQITIDLGRNLDEFEITVTNVIGEMLSKTLYKNSQKAEIRLNTKSGIYFLTIKSANSVSKIKVIKQ